ncbi:MAG: hypothetical protein WBB82_15265 [Limnothrix sp.]
MINQEPSVILVRDYENKTWHIEVNNFSSFRDVIGAKLLNAFSRCFIHVDRLTSLINFGYHNIQKNQKYTPSSQRNLYTMTWFSVGTLYELSESIQELRNSFYLHPTFKLDPEYQKKLKDFDKRWKNKKPFKKMRNSVSFHVDRNIVEDGLEYLSQTKENVIIIEGNGETQQDVIHSLGDEILFSESNMSYSEMETFLEQVVNDLEIGFTITELFQKL